MALLGLGLICQANTFTYTTLFDSSFGSTLTAPFVGSGTLSYDAVSQLPDGFYDWNSFSALAISITVGGTTFTDANLLTPSSQVNIHLISSSFFFSNDLSDGQGSGPQGGSADFGQSIFLLSTEPFNPATPSPCCGGSETNPLYQANTAAGSFLGTYGMIPETSTWIAGGALLRAVGSRWASARWTCRN